MMYVGTGTGVITIPFTVSMPKPSYFLRYSDSDEFYDHIFGKYGQYIDITDEEFLTYKQKTEDEKIKSYIDQYLALKNNPLDSYLSDEYYQKGITNLMVIASRGLGNIQSIKENVLNDDKLLNMQDIYGNTAGHYFFKHRVMLNP